MRRTLQILNFLTAIIMIAVNALSGTDLLGGKTVGAISNQYDTVFAPIGLTFSIWGVIFLWLIIFSVYQARDLFSSKQAAMPFLAQINYWFILANVANTAWIFAWTRERFILSLLLMILLLVSLATIYIRMEVGLRPVSPQVKWLVHVPFSIYLGWISVATIANVSTVLVANGVAPFDPAAFTWAAIMAGVGLLLGMAITVMRADIAYGAVILWALIGIFLKQAELSVPQSVWVRWVAMAGIGGMIAVMVAVSFRLYLAKRIARQQQSSS